MEVEGVSESVGGILGSVVEFVRPITLTSGSVITSTYGTSGFCFFLATGGLVAFVPLEGMFFFLQLFGSEGVAVVVKAGGGVGVSAPTYSCSSLALITSLEPEIHV